MRRSEFNQLILEWNEYLLVESICESLEDQVLAEGLRSFVEKHGATVGLIMTLMAQLNFINTRIVDINEENKAAVEKLAYEKLGEKGIEFIENANNDDYKKALDNLQESDVSKVDFVSYVTRSFKDSFKDSLKKSSIKSFGGIYSKEVYEAWQPSILKNDKFVKEIFSYLSPRDGSKGPSGKMFKHKGMEIYIFPFEADAGAVATEFVKNFFEQITVTVKKSNEKIDISTNSGSKKLEELSKKLEELNINFNVKLFKSALKSAFEDILFELVLNKPGCLGYHYNIQTLVEKFKGAAETLIKSDDYKDLDGKLTIKIDVKPGGFIAIDTDQESHLDTLITIAHELGHALSIDQGTNKTKLFDDFVEFLVDNYDFDVQENNKKISLDMFKTFVQNRMFRGISWTEIKSEKQSQIINICLDFLSQLEGSNFIKVIKNGKEIEEIQLNVDVLDLTQRYYHDPEERVENFKDWVNLFDNLYGQGSAIKSLTEMKDMLEYVKENPESKNRMKKVFSKDLDKQIRFFITKAMFDLKVIDRESRGESLDSKIHNSFIPLIKDNNTKDVSDCLDGVNNLIKIYHSHVSNEGYHTKHIH